MYVEQYMVHGYICPTNKFCTEEICSVYIMYVESLLLRRLSTYIMYEEQHVLHRHIYMSHEQTMKQIPHCGKCCQSESNLILVTLESTV